MALQQRGQSLVYPALQLNSTDEDTSKELTPFTGRGTHGLDLCSQDWNTLDLVRLVLMTMLVLCVEISQSQIYIERYRAY